MAEPPPLQDSTERSLLVTETPTPPSQPDWPAQATKAIVDTVDKVRDRTSGPARTAVAATVYGLVALGSMIMLGILLVVAAVRGLELLLWDRVWLAYLILGGVFTIVGLLCWAKRPRTKPRPSGGTS